MTHALWTLDAANKCIRAVLADVRTEPTTDHLMRKYESLIGLIELTRNEIACATAAMLQVEPANLLLTSRA
jgi:hypothetical protein